MEEDITMDKRINLFYSRVFDRRFVEKVWFVLGDWRDNQNEQPVTVQTVVIQEFYGAIQPRQIWRV
jgi:hypothetical protein